MKRNLLLMAGAAMLAFFVCGCGESSEPTNAEVLKNYKPEPSNNPDIPVTDGANKEFGAKGKPTK